MHNIFIGCDPEIFAAYIEPTKKAGQLENENAFAISPVALEREAGFASIDDSNIKHPVYIQNQAFKIIGDGVAYEINLCKPYQNPREMWKDVQDALAAIGENVQKFGYSLYKKPVINFDYKKYWKQSAMKDPKYYYSTIFGCDTDYDALNPDWHSTILDASTHPYRYAGGHLHISGEGLYANVLPFVKILAILVGNFCLMKSPYPELEVFRAKYYGKPAKYRQQKYTETATGVEYRTPSNSWLSLVEDDFLQIYDLIQQAVSYLFNPNEGSTLMDKYLPATVAAIESANANLSKEILSDMGAI